MPNHRSDRPVEFAPPQAWMSCRQTQAADGWAVTFQWTSSRLPWLMNTSTYKVLKASVWTVSRPEGGQVVREEGPPGLARRAGRPPPPIALDRALAHGDAQL